MDPLIHILPIAIVGTFGAAIALERFMALYLLYPLPRTSKFFSQIREFVLDDRIHDAVRLCERYRSKPISHVVRQALIKASQPEELVEQSLAIAVSQMTQRVQKRVHFLTTIANVSTLLGLFGTILGLINSFQALGGVSAQQRAILLSNGISTAMTATLLGLGVAIPIMLLYSIMASRTNRHVAEIEEAAMRSMEILREHYYRVDEQKPSEVA
ncbi:MAG: MotA/TolQ/ExbB proton channel family protein [Deltaproteobacteria bacterium]|nr:MotA/TolQ/ExbB proton channel family protein [Deltaproteobacteria bacterium]